MEVAGRPHSSTGSPPPTLNTLIYTAAFTKPPFLSEETAEKRSNKCYVVHVKLSSFSDIADHRHHLCLPINYYLYISHPLPLATFPSPSSANTFTTLRARLTSHFFHQLCPPIHPSKDINLCPFCEWPCLLVLSAGGVGPYPSFALY